MDGLERSRLFKDVPIRLGDVKAGQGYLAFAGPDMAKQVAPGQLYE